MLDGRLTEMAKDYLPDTGLRSPVLRARALEQWELLLSRGWPQPEICQHLRAESKSLELTTRTWIPSCGACPARKVFHVAGVLRPTLQPGLAAAEASARLAQMAGKLFPSWL